MSLMGKTCTVIRRTAGTVVDSYGNVIAGTATSSVACEIQQSGRSEPGEQGEFSVTEWKGFFPVGTTFDTGDAISEATMGTFEVIGEPWNADSGSGDVNHVRATLKKTAGAA